MGAYLGLVPSEMTTGGPEKRRLGSITKQGNTYARKMLVQAAWHVLRSRDTGDPIRQWGERIAKTRGKRIAVIAIARKLAGVLWAMWRDGCAYDPVGQAAASAKGTRKEARSKVAHAEALERAAKKNPAANTSPRQNFGGQRHDLTAAADAPRARRCRAPHWRNVERDNLVEALAPALPRSGDRTSCRKWRLVPPRRIPIYVSGLVSDLRCPTNVKSQSRGSLPRRTRAHPCITRRRRADAEEGTCP